MGIYLSRSGYGSQKELDQCAVQNLVDFTFFKAIQFSIGFGVSDAIIFFNPTETLLRDKQDYELTHFFFFLTFSAATPVIISGTIACGIFG